MFYRYSGNLLNHYNNIRQLEELLMIVISVELNLLFGENGERLQFNQFILKLVDFKLIIF